MLLSELRILSFCKFWKFNSGNDASFKLINHPGKNIVNVTWAHFLVVVGFSSSGPICAVGTKRTICLDVVSPSLPLNSRITCPLNRGDTAVTTRSTSKLQNGPLIAVFEGSYPFTNSFTSPLLRSQRFSAVTNLMEKKKKLKLHSFSKCRGRSSLAVFWLRSEAIVWQSA